MKERVYCAAIWYKQYNREGALLPDNITTGIVIRGKRHADCILNFNNLTGLRSVQFGENSCGEFEEGFITNQNRFVGREEAAILAFEAGQIKEIKQKLYSEDIY